MWRFLLYFICFNLILLMTSYGLRSFEEVVEKHDNGNVRKIEVRRFHDSSLTQVKTFHSNKTRESVIKYKKDKKHGKYKTWANNGTLTSTGRYKNDLLNGVLKTFYTDRVLESKVNMLNGKKHGAYTKYFAKGKVQIKEFYRQDTAIGVWERYHSPGKIQEQNSCHSAETQGFIKQWNKNGVLIYKVSCKSGKKHGNEEFYYRTSGNLRQKISFENNIRHGPTIFYLDNGDSTVFNFDLGSGSIITAEAETTWVNGFIHGEIKFFNSTKSVLSIENWEKGELLQRTNYHISPTLDTVMISSGFWEKGKRQGPWTSWFLNGNLKDSLNFIDGEQFGKQYHYDRSGHLYMIKRHYGLKGQVFVEYLNPKPMELQP